MKRDIVILTAAVLFAGSALLHSQDPQKTPLQTLQDIKAANATLIDQQKKTLDTLDDMQKTADQIKAFSKRS
ncbi:MAG: hypothetical protein WCD79_17255 [Chthoniobacteraceae bacterium]